MDNFIIICELFGGLVLIFAIGELIGRLFRLDKILKHDRRDDN